MSHEDDLTGIRDDHAPPPKPDPDEQSSPPFDDIESWMPPIDDEATNDLPPNIDLKFGSLDDAEDYADADIDADADADADEGPTPLVVGEPAGMRSEVRRYTAIVLITSATFLAAGHTLRQPAFMTANDISRWCTVWSLVEKGTYVIDECPWQLQTQDKILWPPNLPQDPTRDRVPESERHFHSSKPALISTVIAGLIYPARRISKIPLDKVFETLRYERNVQKPDPAHPGQFIGVLERPAEPMKWPVYGFYFKPILLLLNVIPFAIFLVFFARVLDRYAVNDWTWFFCMTAATFGTYLLPYTQTLNNHTLGAFATFFAAYHFLWIWDERRMSPARFAAAGFFAGLAAATELPALSLAALMALVLLTRYPLSTFLYFVPASILPVAAFVGAQYAEFGTMYLPYESFGTPTYLYAGSFWETPLELDYFNKEPEHVRVYLFHMLFGHHGIFSLTPLFLFSTWGAARLLGGRRLLTLCIVLTLVTIVGLGAYYLRDPDAWSPGGDKFEYAWLLISIPILFAVLALLSAIPWLRGIDRPMEAMAWMTSLISIVVIAFYAWTPKARNYGGSAQGLRWVMWLIPLWLLLLPRGIEDGRARIRLRRLAMFALALSTLSVGYAMRNPWSHPWILDAMEQLGVYHLRH